MIAKIFNHLLDHNVKKPILNKYSSVISKVKKGVEIRIGLIKFCKIRFDLWSFLYTRLRNSNTLLFHVSNDKNFLEEHIRLQLFSHSIFEISINWAAYKAKKRRHRCYFWAKIWSVESCLFLQLYFNTNVAPTIIWYAIVASECSKQKYLECNSCCRLTPDHLSPHNKNKGMSFLL